MREDIKERLAMIERGEVPEGYKKDKKHIIPNAWSRNELGIFEDKIGSGKTPYGGERTYINEGIPFIRSQNVLNNKLDINNVVYISKETHDEMKATKIMPNDILLNITGASIGRCCLVPNTFKNGNLNQHVCIIRTKEVIDREFLVQVLISDIGQNQIHFNQAGGNREGLNFEQIRNIEIPVPPISEQKKISDILVIWDRAIELKEKLLKQKKLQKKGLMERLLTGKVRLPGFSGEWRKIKLRDVVERVTRRNDAGNTNVLTISARRGLISQTDYFNRSVASETLDNYFLLKEGEFAYNKSYSNGYPMGTIKRLNGYSEGVVTTLYICFKLRDDTSNSDFFEQYFEAGLLNKALMKITQEGARAHGLLNIAVSDFFEMSICIPPKLEQEAIADLLVCLDSVIQKNEQEIYQLKAQKKGLMQLLLTGKIRVPC